MKQQQEEGNINAVHVQNLAFSYGGPPILHDVSLSLPMGSRTLLIGSNGAGSK
jgi:ABC-type Mn2+/Zn2+ transport system ATPase subunit